MHIRANLLFKAEPFNVGNLIKSDASIAKCAANLTKHWNSGRKHSTCVNWHPLNQLH